MQSVFGALFPFRFRFVKRFFFFFFTKCTLRSPHTRLVDSRAIWVVEIVKLISFAHFALIPTYSIRCALYAIQCIEIAFGRDLCTHRWTIQNRRAFFRCSNRIVANAINGCKQSQSAMRARCTFYADIIFFFQMTRSSRYNCE